MRRTLIFLMRLDDFIPTPYALDGPSRVRPTGRHSQVVNRRDTVLRGRQLIDHNGRPVIHTLCSRNETAVSILLPVRFPGPLGERAWANQYTRLSTVSRGMVFVRR